MSETLVKYTVEEGVATLELNDGKANALGYDMIAALSEALTRAESEARVAVIVGRPGKFCAGFDLKVMQRGLADALRPDAPMLDPDHQRVHRARCRGRRALTRILRSQRRRGGPIQDRPQRGPHRLTAPAPRPRHRAPQA